MYYIINNTTKTTIVTETKHQSETLCKQLLLTNNDIIFINVPSNTITTFEYVSRTMDYISKKYKLPNWLQLAIV